MPRARPNESGGASWPPRPQSDRQQPAAAYQPSTTPPATYQPATYQPATYQPATYQPGPPAGPPPGRYRDPGGLHQFRFWNGWGWTPGVANGPYVGQDFRAPPPVPVLRSPTGPDTRVQLPKVAAAYGLGGIVVSVGLSFLGAFIAALAFPHNREALLLLSQAGLWSGLVGAVWLASRRFGTGNVWRDFGVRFEGLDVPIGLVSSIGARIGAFILLIPLVLIDRRLIGSDVAPLKGTQQSPAVLITVVVFVILGAPFIEELFFRGLLLRSLLPIVGTAGAIVLQGVVFGSLHMRPSYGLGNVSILLVIGAFGIVQGVIAERFRRLGPGIVSHGFFNLVALVLALALRQLA